MILLFDWGNFFHGFFTMFGAFIVLLILVAVMWGIGKLNRIEDENERRKRSKLDDRIDKFKDR